MRTGGRIDRRCANRIYGYGERMPERSRSRSGAPSGTRLLGTAFLAFVMLFATVAPTAEAAGDDWTIEGGGWGHGIGLSQYGAHGMGLGGFTANEILAHYYSGATAVPTADVLGADHWILHDEAFWVGLVQDTKAVTIGAVNGAIAVCQTGDGSDGCAAPDFVVPPGSTWRFEMISGSDPIRCRFVELGTGTTQPEADCRADITWVDNADLTDPSAANLVRVNGGRTYAHGSLRIRPNDPNPGWADAFHVSLSIGLEEYLAGVGEMPSSWSTAALESQAVAARSFGVVAATVRAPDGTLGVHRQRACWCHLDPTSSDQNYVGWSKESEGRDAVWGRRWVAAVEATDGLVLTHPSTGNSIIKTYYSSSTGGATENNEDVWGGSPRAYLRSVDDHWAVEPAVRNPYATWTVNVSQSSMLGALNEGWEDVLSARVISGPPGTVVEFTGTLSGAKVTTTRNGTWFRREFGVRSPYVSAVIPPGTVSPFVDIAESIHYDSIAYIWREGITKGCNPPTNDRFCPDGDVTRGQMAAFLTRALELSPTGEDSFVDDEDSIFENDINRLAAAGITKGCNPPTNDRFCPNDGVTRGQMAAFLVRAFGYSDSGAGDLFTDDDDSIFESDIDRLGTAGITKGCNPPSNTRFCPDRVVIRAEMATFLFRALE